MSQDAHERVNGRVFPTVRRGHKPGDVRIKIRRRSRGKIGLASLRVRSLVHRVVSH